MKLPAFYGTRRFITLFRGTSSRPCVTLRNQPTSYSELLAPFPIPKLEENPLSAVHDGLFSKFDQ